MKFPGAEFLETTPKFIKRKKNSSCVYVLHKTSHQEISRPGRAVTATKCTKKCDARADLFWFKPSVVVVDVLVAVVVAKAPYNNYRYCKQHPLILKGTRRYIFGKSRLGLNVV